MLDQNGPNGDDEYRRPGPARPPPASFSACTATATRCSGPGTCPSRRPTRPSWQTIGRKLAYYTGYDPRAASATRWMAPPTTGPTASSASPSFTFEVGSGWWQLRRLFPGLWLHRRHRRHDPQLLGREQARLPLPAQDRPHALHDRLRPRRRATSPSRPTWRSRRATSVDLTATIADHRYAGDPLQPIAGAEYFVDAPGEDGTGTPHGGQRRRLGRA